MTLIYARPHREVPLASNVTRPVPVLLKVETTDTTAPDATVRPQLAVELESFLKGVDLVKLTQPYGQATGR